jgi:hypothetical protein
MTTGGFVEVVEYLLVTFYTFQHLIQCGTVTMNDNTSSLLWFEKQKNLIR